MKTNHENLVNKDTTYKPKIFNNTNFKSSENTTFKGIFTLYIGIHMCKKIQ